VQINILTVVPEFFEGVLSASILGRAVQNNLVKFKVMCLRDFADGKIGGKKMVDDASYGGGAGMVLKIEPIARALHYLEEKGQKGYVILTDARGEVFSQHTARSLVTHEYITIICGHYEGVDERASHYVDAKISLGQFIMTGGEIAASAISDAVVRLIPGVLGNAESLLEESHNVPGEMEYPQYTRPVEFEGHRVPEILLSGDHAAVAKWRASGGKVC
jgi:tRNA (guanine37-N1)-methyltransferase